MGYSDQATSETPRRRRGEAKTYDFRRPVRLAREHAHLLRVAMTTFGRQSTTVLTTTLRAVSSLTLTQVEELSYDEYLTGLPEHAVCAVLEFEPLPGKAILTIDQKTMLTMIDHILGGPGSDEQPDRPLSDIEQSVAKFVISRVIRELTYALEAIVTTTPELIGLENNAQFVQIAAATDPVVVARFDLIVGKNVSDVRLCLPYSMLSARLEAVSQTADVGKKALLRLESAERTAARLADVDVEVAVRFEAVGLPSAEIGQLTVGDILPLEHRLAQPLVVTSAGTTFAQAVPGASGKKLAALIVSGR